MGTLMNKVGKLATIIVAAGDKGKYELSGAIDRTLDRGMKSRTVLEYTAKREAIKADKAAVREAEYAVYMAEIAATKKTTTLEEVEVLKEALAAQLKALAKKEKELASK